MIILPRRMLVRWCKVDGEPGYLLSTGAKVRQTAVRFEDVACTCGKVITDKRQESYHREFGLCLKCHSSALFPTDERKAARYYLEMQCTRWIGIQGQEFEVDYVLCTIKRIK